MSEKTKNIILVVVGLLALIMSILNGSYIIGVMYIVAITFITYILKIKEKYDLLYSLLLISLFFDYALYIPGVESIYMFHIMLFIFTIASFLKVINNKHILKKVNKFPLIIMSIWFMYICVSIIWALNKALSLKYIAIYIMMFTFISNVLIYNTTKERIEKTVKISILLVSMIALIGFTEVLLGTQLPIKHYIDTATSNLPQIQKNIIDARPVAFSYNTNNLAATLSILSPICFFAIYRFKSVVIKYMIAAIGVISFILVVLTSSRTGFVAMLFGFSIYLIVSILKLQNIGIKQIIYPAILLLTFVLAYNYGYKLLRVKPVENQKVEVSNTLSDKLNTLVNTNEIEEGESGSINVRGTIIKEVIKGVFIEKNYLGFGVGNVEQYIADTGKTGNIISPHAYIIEILGDFGIIGIIIYGVLYSYLLLMNLINGIKKNDYFSWSMVAALIAFAPASFGPSSITYVLAYWVLLALAMIAIQFNKIKN